MKEEHAHPPISLEQVDAVLQQTLRPFTDSRLGNSIRFYLNRKEEVDRITFTVSIRSREATSPLPSLQFVTRQVSQGITIHYEILPEGVSDQLLLEGKYSLGYLKSLVHDASQFFFMAISRASQPVEEEPEERASPAPLKQELSDQQQTVEEDVQTPISEPEQELEELDLFDYSDFGDNSVQLDETPEPLHIEL